MRLRHLIPLTALVLPLAACGAGDEDDGRATVIVSAYPFEYLVDEIAGDLVRVENLTKPGVDAHDVELSPRQVGDVQSAEVVVYVEHFQAAVDAAVEQADRDDEGVVELGEVVSLLGEDDEHAHDHGDDSDEHGHDDEHGHEDEHGHDEEGHEDEGHDHDAHDHGGVDPHFWLDPVRMVRAAEAVADALIATDPDNADEYRANADALVGRLEALDTSFTEGLQTCERRTIVTSHAAFAYLASAYDLRQVPIAGLEPTQEPSGKQLAEITDLVQAEGITTVFTEELADDSMAETVASATGVTTATLDPIEGRSDATADQDYLSLMQRNLDAIREANACA